MGWQLILPPSRRPEDINNDEELIYNVAYNQAGIEHREAEYKEFFNPDSFT